MGPYINVFYCCCVYEWNCNLCNRFIYAIDIYFSIRLSEIPGCNSPSWQVSSGLALRQQNISGPCMPPLHPNINHQHLPHSLETVDLWQPTTENLTGVHFYHYREVANTSLIINWYLYLTWSLLVFCYLCNSKEFVLYQAYSKFHPQVNGKDLWYGNTIKQLYLQSSTQENTY